MPRREQISKNLLVPEDGLLDVACKDGTLMGGGGGEKAILKADIVQ